MSVTRQLTQALWSGRLDAASRTELVSGLRRFVSPEIRREHGTLGPPGGLVYRLERREGARWHADCWDRGGILDENPNTEMSPWPPQAMGMYYADAYAASIFACRATAEGEPWREGAMAALDHARRTYRRYVAGPIWYHHEFKNAPMMEAWLALGQPDGASWIDRLHSDNYAPTNVMAVRLHWVALRRRIRPQRGDDRRIARARSRLLMNQDSDGLFRDDRPPYQRGVRDLSYHMFTLGFLARYLDLREDAEMTDAFLRGVELAIHLQLPDGGVALTGRGTNNVYHQAAAVLAFARAAAVDRRGGQCAQAAFIPIQAWQRNDGFLPTALNSHAEERMAWNHCATPYIALTCYLLAHASEQPESAGSGTYPSTARAVMGDTFARLSADVDLVFSAGYTGSTWSGRHGSGVAGTAGLVHSGRHIFLALDQLADYGLQVTDLPQVVLAGEELDWRRTGRLSHRPFGVDYSVRTPTGVAMLSLTVHGATVKVEVRLPVETGVTAFARLPLLEGRSVQWEPAPECGVEEIHVPSNPRGAGRIITWPLHFDSGRASYAYRVTASGITVLTRP